MSSPLCFTTYTCNVLGAFFDPFEFEGDYGVEVNEIRQKVFDLVVSKKALVKNLTDSQIKNQWNREDASAFEINNYRYLLLVEAERNDRTHGPILAELVTSDLISLLKEKQQELLQFKTFDFVKMISFINRFADQKMFYFFKNCPPSLLCLDKILLDQSSQLGIPLNLPILSSTMQLDGSNSQELKKSLLNILFTNEILSLTKPEAMIRSSIDKLEEHFLKHFLGENSKNEDLETFCSPAGQVFFYWLYQSLNLHLISEMHMIEEVNKVKVIFASTIGDSKVRAQIFKEKLLATNSGVVFTQESDTFVPQALLENGLFLPVNKQNPQDGTFVFLRSDLWEQDYEVIPVEKYEGFLKGKLNLILATSKHDGRKFLFSSAHGNSTNPEDGRLQISLIKAKFDELQHSNTGLQLLIGTDANTKSEQEVQDLKVHLNTLGLVSTSVGPSTIKRRMVTVQHPKAGRFAIDEEDYLITLKQENGGMFLLKNPTVGFNKEKSDVNIPLPNIDNLSDHYPVGATLSEVNFLAKF